jgi:release factor glutamine methyltransferase
LIASAAIADLARNLEAAGLESPAVDARAMVLGVMGIPVETLISRPDLRLTPAQLRRLARWRIRRIGGTPVSRLLGYKEFWSLRFQIGASTLDPRPDSETLVAAALAHALALPPRPLKLLDLGTGSGCLLLALASELKGATGLGVDISTGAVRVARANAKALGLDDRVRFQQGDWARGLAGPFDLIVANPPYVTTDDLEYLSAEVLCDPLRALDGGQDGLDPYRVILAQVPPLLAPDGLLVFEFGYDQAEALSALILAAGGRIRQLAQDLAGRDRVLVVDFRDGSRQYPK